jgi:hypothetical protein
LEICNFYNEKGRPAGRPFSIKHATESINYGIDRTAANTGPTIGAIISDSVNIRFLDDSAKGTSIYTGTARNTLISDFHLILLF